MLVISPSTDPVLFGSVCGNAIAESARAIASNRIRVIIDHRIAVYAPVVFSLWQDDSLDLCSFEPRSATWMATASMDPACSGSGVVPGSYVSPISICTHDTCVLELPS
jgi:hypothetical protein